MKNNLIALSSTIALLAASGITRAHDDSIDVPEGSGGYVITSSGTALISSDTCIRSSTWSEDNQINVCEGIEEPVAALEPATEPVPTQEPVAAPLEPTITLATLGGEALFATNSHELNSAGNSALSDLVGRLGAFQDIESMVITGHTDATGSERYNQDLSERRAATVAGFLSAAFPGVSISSIGAGESSPIDTNNTSEGRQANRRVEIEVTAKSLVGQS